MSDININKIDRNFPEPGRDNDSFGFRNNFSEISDNLSTAKTEIEDLQENVVRTDKNSDLNGQKITDVDLVKSTKQVYALGNISANEVVDFSNGSYQTITVAGDITLTLTGWPASERKASIMVALLSDSTARTVTWDVDGDGSLKRNLGETFDLTNSTYGDSTFSFTFTVGQFPNPFIVNSEDDPVIVEFWSVDGGDTVYANYIGQFT